jgi:hypothetical protein
MKTIFKYPLEITDTQIISVSGGEAMKPLFVAEQNDILCLWGESCPDSDYGPVVIRIYGTGQPMDEDTNLSYIGSATQHDGRAVWHVYVLKSEKS